MRLAPDSPVFDISELVERLNRVSRPRRDGKPAWNRWKVIRLLRKHGVLAAWRPGVPRQKFFVTLAALRRAFPDLWDSLLDAEALRDAA